MAVTHEVTRAKLRKIRRRDLPAIEIRLDPSDSLLPRESLKEKLQRDLISKVWLFHPGQREAERQFASKFRNALARSRVRVPLVSLSALPRRLVMRSSPVNHSTARPDWREWNRVGENFNRRNGRYPTLEECRKLWPFLFDKLKP